MESNVTIVSVLAVLISTLLSLVAIPKIITLAVAKRLFDMPDNERKVHKRIVPYLGGVAIFGSACIASVLLLDHSGFENWTYVRAATLLLFFVGIKDDISDLKATHKLVIQLLAAVMVVGLADIRLGNFYGIFGLHELPLWFSYVFSVIGIAFVTNAFNLIDGIDGLAGSIGAFASMVFGIFFALAGQAQFAVVSFTLFGAILGFLYYNRSPAKIFMGDTGSLFIGFMLAVLSVCFINSRQVYLLLAHNFHVDGPALKYTIVLAILFVPIFDTLRVFAMRAARGVSPFRADRHHLHHYLLDIGFSHNRIVFTLLISSVLLLLTCGLVNNLNVHLGIAALFTIAFGLFVTLYHYRRHRLHAKESERPVETLHLVGQPMIAATDGLTTVISDGEQGGDMAVPAPTIGQELAMQAEEEPAEALHD